MCSHPKHLWPIAMFMHYESRNAFCLFLFQLYLIWRTQYSIPKMTGALGASSRINLGWYNKRLILVENILAFVIHRIPPTSKHFCNKNSTWTNTCKDQNLGMKTNQAIRANIYLGLLQNQAIKLNEISIHHIAEMLKQE